MEQVRSLLILWAELFVTCPDIGGCRSFSIAVCTAKSPSFGFQFFFSGLIPWFSFSKFCRYTVWIFFTSFWFMLIPLPLLFSFVSTVQLDLCVLPFMQSVAPLFGLESSCWLCGNEEGGAKTASASHILSRYWRDLSGPPFIPPDWCHVLVRKPRRAMDILSLECFFFLNNNSKKALLH